MTVAASISFKAASEDDPSPYVVVHNPGILPLPLVSQLKRFGLLRDRQTLISGKLQGSQQRLIEMIQSYGVVVDVTGSLPATRIKETPDYPDA